MKCTQDQVNNLLKKYLDNAILSKTAYSDLSSGMSVKEVFDSLTKKNIFNQQNFTEAEALAFAGIEKVNDGYDFIKDAEGNRISGNSIIASTSDYGIGTFNGFDAVLIKNNETGNLTLSIRGTSPSSPADLLADINLALSGEAHLQEASMETFYQKLVSEEKIPANTKIDVTGHSLGGFLAQKFTINHSNIVNNTPEDESPLLRLKNIENQ